MKKSDLKEGAEVYVVMQMPKFAMHGKLRMSPEVFDSKEKALAYVEEYRRRGFLASDDLWILDVSSSVEIIVKAFGITLG